MLTCTSRMFVRMPMRSSASTFCSPDSPLILLRGMAALPAVRPSPAEDYIAHEKEKESVIAVPPNEDEEIYQMIKEIACHTELESPRLFGSYGVGKPLFGELAPIRKREHRYEPIPWVKSKKLEQKVKHLRPSTNHMAFLQKERDKTLRGVLQWFKERMLQNRRAVQAYDADLVRKLGPEIAAARFVVRCGGKMKFHGVERYYSFRELEKQILPNRLIESATVEEVDLSKTNILYEGLDNLLGMRKLRKLSFRNCPDIDDFCLPKLFIFGNTLEYLDLSGCHKITERGLACLYHLRNLKTLIIDNLPNAENKELTALLLEDELPLLEIRGVEYNKIEERLTPLQAKEEQEKKWLSEDIPLYHLTARPDTVEVGNLAYCQIQSKEKETEHRTEKDLKYLYAMKKPWHLPWYRPDPQEINKNKLLRRDDLHEYL